MLAKEALNIDNKNVDAHQCAGNAYMSKADYELFPHTITNIM